MLGKMNPTKPTALKIIQGNPGKRPLNKHEPKPTPGCKMPKFLKGRAARIWGEFAPELERVGVLTTVDGPMLAAWCLLVAKMETAFDSMTAAEISQMRMISAVFGMEPSSRARLSVKPDEPVEDPAAKYLAG
jgi:phage terminase small subunit